MVIAVSIVPRRLLRIGLNFRQTYEKGQATSLFIMGGVAGAVLAAIDGNELIDAVRFRLQGRVDGAPFSVEIAEAYEAGSYSGMIYNGDGVRAATVAIAIVGKGIGAGVTAVEAAIAAIAANSAID